MFANLYRCSKHGEVWHVEHTEMIDTENDEVDPIVLCSICLQEVYPVIHDGHQVCHALTDEEMQYEMMFSEADEDDSLF